jgi:signal transduction histidine kinase
MPARQKLELRKIHPLRSFSLILAVLFTIESLVMFLLPTIVPNGSSPPVYAFIDACLLTCVLAPMLWLMIVNPLQRLASTRQRLLAIHLSSLESERHRIALDLHDGLGQSLTVLTVGLRTIEETSTESAVQAQARELRRIGGNTHDELRRLVHGMRPAVLDDLGLIPALERFVGDLNISNCIEARLQVHCVAAVNLCEEVQISVFRMVQEAATNAIRHGNARQLTIKMN